MTLYEYLKSGEEYCEEQARRFCGDIDMRIFWINSADDYRARALRLTAEEASLPYLTWSKP